MKRGCSSPLTPLALATCGLALAFVGTLEAGPQWGTRSYDEERPLYLALVSSLDRRHNDLSERKRQVEGKLQGLIDGLSWYEKSAALDDYRRTDSYRNQTALLENARIDEEEERKDYEVQRSGRPNEQLPGVRSRYWAAHIEWLQARNALVEREIEAADAQLVVMTHQTTSAWDEFWADTFDDVVYIFKEVVVALVGDIYQCFEDKVLDGFSVVLGNAPTGMIDPSFSPQNLWAQGPLTVGDLVNVQACIDGPLMKTVVNALSTSLKKQFIDAHVSENRVLPEVAAWWWDEIVAAKPPDKTFAQRVQQRMMSRTTLENAVKQHVDETAIRLYAQDEAAALEQRYNSVLKTTKDPAQVRKTMRGIARERAQNRFADKANPVQQAARSAALGIDIFAELYKLYENSAVFREIESNEVARYQKVVACLTSKNETPKAGPVIAVLKAPANQFASWLRDCKQQQDANAAAQAAQTADLVPILQQLQALAAAIEAQLRGAEAGCATSRTQLDALKGRLDAVTSKLAALETSIPQTATPGPGAGDPVAEATRLADAMSAAAAQVVEAKQRVEDGRDRACRAAVAAAMARTPEDHSRQLAEAAAATGDARSQNAVAQSAATRAATAWQQFQALLQPPAPTSSGPDPKAELAAAKTELESIESEAGRHDGTAATAQDASDALDQARTRAASLYNAALSQPSAGSGGADTSDKMRQIEGAFGRIQNLGGGALTACIADLPPLIAEVRTGHAAARTRATTVEAKLPSGSGGPRIPAGVTQLASSARASADTAEIYADATDAIAADAEACRQQAVNIRVPTAPTPTPTPPPLPPSPSNPQAGGAGTAGGGWTGGNVTTLSDPGAGPTTPQPDPTAPPTGGSGADPQGPVTPVSGTPLLPSQPGYGRIDVSGIIAGIRAAKDACNMAQAMALVAQVDALDPGNAWVAANRGVLQRMAQGQAAAYGFLQQGQAALQANDLAGASQAAQQAASAAPSCMRPKVEPLVAAVNSAIQAEDARQRADRQRTAGGILSGLISVVKVVGAVRGGKAQDIANALSGASGGNTGLGGAIGTLFDPCSIQFAPPTAANPSFSCTCPGYTFQGGVCVAPGGVAPGGAGGGPVAVDTRTTTCGATSKSGADAPASITVNMQGLSGTANFSYNMITVKDRMMVRQGNQVLLDTGCVSGSNSVGLPISPMGGPVTVIVQPACEKSGTQWSFTLGCPQ